MHNQGQTRKCLSYWLNIAMAGGNIARKGSKPYNYTRIQANT